MQISQLNGNTLVDATFHEYINTEGAVIYSFNSAFSPSAVFGGSWEKLTDRVIVGAGGSYALNGEGGEATHKHGEAFSVSTDQTAVKVKVSQTGDYVSWGFTRTDFRYGQDNVSINGAYQLVTDNATSMPPYKAANIWVRQ